MRYHHVAPVAALILGSISLSWSSAWAADDVTTLRAALGHIPEAMLATEDPTPIAYLDVKAMSRFANGALSDVALKRLTFARLIRPLEVLEFGMGKSWTQKAGIAFEDVSYFAGNAMPPVKLAYWGLADAKAATTLLHALGSRGFKEIQPTPRVLANGEPRGINFEAVDAESPWLGYMGQTSVVATRDDMLIQATAPDDLKPTLDLTRSIADNSAFATVLEGIEKAPSTNRASILQALVITPLFGLSAIDTSDILLDSAANVEEMKKKLEARMAEGNEGIPPYLGGILLDTQKASGPAFVVSLAYTDCATAEIAMVTIRKRWIKAMIADRVGEITGDAIPGKDGGCAAVMSFASRAEVNEPLLDAYGSFVSRKFNFLQIGKPE